MTKVFISYSHDSQPHLDFVRKLADQLRTEGLDCLIDQYINGFPPEGWQNWMENQVEAADFVLLVCTETYLKRYRGQETNGGKGVSFEGVVISQILYDNYYQNTKFVPIIPMAGNIDNVPLPLKHYSTLILPLHYDKLYRYLTGQPEIIAPIIGGNRIMPPKQDSPIIAESLPLSHIKCKLRSINVERKARLEEKLNKIYQQHDLETRVDEKMRIMAIIEQTEKDLRELEILN